MRMKRVASRAERYQESSGLAGCRPLCVCVVQVLYEVKALGNFTAEEEDDLSFKEREILAVLESRSKLISGGGTTTPQEIHDPVFITAHWKEL